jgi:hypothetical protein
MPAAARTIEVVGLKDLRRDLRRAAKEFPAELAKANEKAAEVVAKEARLRAPEGRHEGGGAVMPIKASIVAARRGSKGVVSIGGMQTPYAIVTEFGGTIPRRAPRGQKGIQRRQVSYARKSHRSFESVGVRQVTHVRKQPYLYPALDAKLDEVLEVYNKLVADIMQPASGSGSGLAVAA